ncbi:polymeric immunoglobulin receptor-like isoform X2 [Salminus brasiliensis]|uniref:polymeric immunoglobulin receptor-like isoform X2 n=1 Tax=Salminus brasiliensis TaxID=930266 RepID=UPI003B838A17
MKIFIFFTLYLISGSGSCFDVIGYSGGTVIIQFDLWWYSSHTKYIWKIDQTKCINKIPPDSRSDCVYDGRFKLTSSKTGHLMVFIRGLNPQDAGVYRLQVGEMQSSEVELKIMNNDCCEGTKTLSGSQGETLTISCNYPEQFQDYYKSLFKLDDLSITEILNTGTGSQRGRISISDDKRSEVLRVRISDVREDDGGVYPCGVFIGEDIEGYYTFFTEIQLQVTGSSAITVSVCVVLLLIGITLILFYVIHKKRQGITLSSSMELKDNKPVPTVVSDNAEIKQPEHLPDSDIGIYAKASTPANSSDKHLHSTVQPSKNRDLTYTTVSFQKNPGSPTHASVNMLSVKKE